MDVFRSNSVLEKKKVLHWYHISGMEDTSIFLYTVYQLDIREQFIE